MDEPRWCGSAVTPRSTSLAPTGLRPGPAGTGSNPMDRGHTTSGLAVSSRPGSSGYSNTHGFQHVTLTTMAGPGKSGPPKRGQEEVEFARLRADVVKMRSANMTHSEIARRTGLSRPTVTQMLPKIYRELLADSDVVALIANHFQRCEAMLEQLWPDVLAPQGDINLTTFEMRTKAIETVLKILKDERDGRNFAKGVSITVNVGGGSDDIDGSPADKIADNVEAFMNLADKLVFDGIGSGRARLATRLDGFSDVVDGDEVDEATMGNLRPFLLAELVGEEGAPIRTPESPAQGWREFLAERQGPKKEVKEERPSGRWVAGKFLPQEDGSKLRE